MRQYCEPQSEWIITLSGILRCHKTNHELLQFAGINVNSRVNTIFLPSTEDLHEKRSIHRGCHTDSYSREVANRMDRIVAEEKVAGCTQGQYQDATRIMLSELRQELKAGNIGLNKNHRSWATKW
jgi:hypothetical protein